jgi:hypothetical protein
MMERRGRLGWGIVMLLIWVMSYHELCTNGFSMCMRVWREVGDGLGTKGGVEEEEGKEDREQQAAHHLKVEAHLLGRAATR